MAAPALLRLDDTDSTQLAARALIAEGAPHGTLVVARRQRQGRGRLGRAWQSDEGGLWLSMILRGALPAARAPRLTLGAAALALQALDTLGVHAAVKWPNDLMLAHPVAAPRLGPWRKLGGLILEGVELDGAVVRSAVLGIGINVVPPAGGFAPPVDAVATSLQAAGAAVSVEDVLQALGPRLQAQALDALDDAPFAAQRALLTARSATLRQRVEVDGVRGLAEAIDDDGALRVRDDDGTVHVVRAGDVWTLAGPGDRSGGAGRTV